MSNNLSRRVLGACAIVLVLALILAPLPVAAQEVPGEVIPPPGPPADMVPEQPLAEDAMVAEAKAAESGPAGGDAQGQRMAPAAPEIGGEDEGGTSCLNPTKDIASDRSTYADSGQAVVGSTLKIGKLVRETVTLLHFNPAGSIPTNSTISSATVKLHQNGVEAGSGNININAYRANKGWAAPVTFAAAMGMFGNQFSSSSAGTGSATINFGNAKAVAAEWLAQGPGNFGAIFRGSSGGIHNFSTGATLHVEYKCDKQAPTAEMQNFSKPWHKADFGVSWRGSDPAMTNCTATGIEKFTVEYSTDNKNWVKYSDSTSGDSCTSSTQTRSKEFHNSTYHFADGATVYFRVTSKDRVGNTQKSHSASISTRLDLAPPSIDYTPLEPYTFGTSFNVQWTAHDNASGVSGCTLEQLINKGKWTPAPGTITRNGDQFTYTFTGAQNGQRLGFKAICTDNAGNNSPTPEGAQVATTISAYPMAVMSNITPNLVQSTAAEKENLVIGWRGLTSPSVPITGFSVYARHTTGAQWGSWKKWKDVAASPSNSYSEKFPFTTEDPANPNGLWDFQVVAHSAQGDPPFDNSKAQASAVVDLQDKGQRSFIPDMAKR